MAWVDDDDDLGGPNPYAALLDACEHRYARRGGHRVLVKTIDDAGRPVRTVRTVSDPGPLLTALRSGLPVVVDDWQVPSDVRDGPVQGKRFRLHPDGHIDVVPR